MKPRTLEELVIALQNQGWKVVRRQNWWFADNAALHASVHGEESFKQWAVATLEGLRSA